MIGYIAADISKLLIHSIRPHDFDDFVGMGDHMEMMNKLLRLDLKDEVRMVGIWGPSGIGKTSIATNLYHQISRSFQNSAIIVNIKRSYPKPCFDEYNAQLQLHEAMLSQMLNQKDIVIHHLGIAQEWLRDKKVLLVLDDVDQSAQLDALAKNGQWFGPGSRIIITTENIRVLKTQMIDLIYKVNFPSIDESLEIFCMYAFGCQKSPEDGFYQLAREITYLVGRLPLALKVMGSHFKGLLGDKKQWSMEVSRLRDNINGDIESILMFSYDALCEEDKSLFLHIACFFNNEETEKVEEYLVKRFKYVRQMLHGLAEKSLLSLDGISIYMHNLLVQLGKEIVRKQSVSDPGQRLFLDDDEDIWEVITNSTATSTRHVIGIDSKYQLDVTEKAFEGLCNLQFLRVEYNVYKQNIISSLVLPNYISQKLRLLDWSQWPMKCLPSTITLKYLVELRMGHSKLEKLWDGIKLLPNLKWMSLEYSRNLKKLPDLSTATSLKELDLSGCSSLVELPSSIRNATNLQYLNISFCSSLVSIPQLPDSLTYLNAEVCNSLERLDCFICNPTFFLNFEECFKLSQEAKDLIIKKSTLESAILPGKQVPACFTYRAYGSSVTVKLNQKHLLLRTSTKFKACILFGNMGEYEDFDREDINVSCSITSKKNVLSTARRLFHHELLSVVKEHLYIFEFEADDVTSTELVFEFSDTLPSWSKFSFQKKLEIKECGVLQLLDHHDDECLR